ncbi:glycosyltransferase [Terriglobus roseus]|uniref:Glycosyltransferase involved in cell wall bisynthesis n=1 Tax=Terriglobus roseus TaxID=392734 RepID=A0A1H4TX04_9BACT|nr:glycosyltransferase [Terriglobus roseus]SEC61053.1 Glycosyltransferase involved in cell wall bisynthesis [Terriglobus roseus]
MKIAEPTHEMLPAYDVPSLSAEKRPVRRLRVLHVLEATLGGTLRYLENIGQSMKDSPFEFGFAFGQSRADSRLEPFLETIREQGWSTFPVDMRREISIGQEFRNVLALKKIIREFRPDVLHCHSSKAGVLGRLAAYSPGRSTAVIYSPHAIAVPLGKKYLYIERALRRMVRGFIAVSPSEAADIVRYGLCSPWAVRVVNPAIDTEYFSPRNREMAKADLGLSHTPLLLGIGRMTPQKDPLAFLEVFKKVKVHVTDAKAIWMGEGELKNAFLQRASQLGLEDDIQVVPWQHDIRTYLAAADVLLGTSVYESFGYMIAEALAMEVPVVSTAVSGPRDILVGPLAANTYALGDLAEATSLVTRLLLEQDQAAYYGSIGRPLIEERFSKDAMRAALTDCYRTIVA